MLHQLIVCTKSEEGKRKQMQAWKESTSRRRCGHAHSLIASLGEIPSGNMHVDLIDSLLFWSRHAFLWLW